MLNRVEDITTHPKRTQAGNVELAGTAFDRVMSMQNGIPEPDSAPTSFTLENVIEYYSSHAEGPLKKLYEYTAFILEKYRQYLIQTIRMQEESSASDSEDYSEEPDSDIEEPGSEEE